MPLGETAGQITGVVTVSLDITQQKEAQKLNTLLATAVEHAGDVIEITDAASHFEYVNSAFERISGYSRADALGQTPFSLLMSDRNDEPHYRAVQNAIASGQVWHGTLTGRRKDGTLYEQEATISPVRDAEGVITHYVAVKRDITERLQTQARIWHLAHHDALTDLPNRVLFQDRLQQAVAQARRSGLLVAILFIDLDNFKDVNDALGHEFGDLLLKAVTLRLRGCTRETDTVARLGGDEFALIHTGLERSQSAAKLAEKVLERLSEPFSLEGQEVHISASIGVTICPLDHDDPQQIVKNADMAMYRAKNTGRSNYQFYKEEMNLAFQARKALERELRKALANGELDLYYQPQIDARSSVIVGAEALVRWPHPERGMISPGEFVPIAEESGLIVPLGEWVLQTACTQNRVWRDLGLPPVRVAVNLSAAQFLYRDLMASVIRALETSGLDHAHLELEITEGILMRETEVTINTLRRLAELGIQIAVDDFGTGYSSMAYLKRFPVSKIKIDRAFVTDVTTDRGDAAIVGAVIGLAHGLGPLRRRRGRRDPRTGRTPARAWLRRAPGLLFRPPDDRRLVPGAPRRHEWLARHTQGAAARALARRSPLTFLRAPRGHWDCRRRSGRPRGSALGQLVVLIGQQPAQMLAAIEHDHLPGHRGRRQDEVYRTADLFGRSAAPQGQRGAQATEARRRLMDAWQGGTRTDRIDANRRRERRRQRFGQYPQRGLAERIREEMGAQVPHALVDDVDDVALYPLLQLSGEVLDQHERGAQIALQVQVPRCPGGIERAIALECRGVVDQAAERPQRFSSRGHEPFDLVLAGQIGAERSCAAAFGTDLCDQLVRGRFRVTKVDADRPPAAGKIERDAAPDALGRAGHQHDGVACGAHRSAVGPGPAWLANFRHAVMSRRAPLCAEPSPPDSPAERGARPDG